MNETSSEPETSSKPKPRRSPGQGSLWKRGGVWWIRYYLPSGKQVAESSRSPDERRAKRLLAERLGALANHLPINPKAEKIRVDELLSDLATEYTVNGRKSGERLGFSTAHLLSMFQGMRAVQVNASVVRKYIERRQAAGAANGTINRELAALKRAFTLGFQAQKILTMPHIPGLKEANARAGFFERDAFERVQAQLPDALKPLVHVAYITGWRIKSELLPLTWDRVDFKAGWPRLEPGTTKNDEGRMFPFTPELRAVLEAQRAHTDEIQRAQNRIIPTVFHRGGKPIKDYRGAWDAACERAGLPGRIPHDFRRTAVRNLERAGVPRSVAMKMTGHKTESVYRRYAIVDEAMLREGAEKLAHASAASTITSTVAPLRPRQGAASA